MISALVLLAAAQPDELAFVSRFYKPGTASSKLELYLSALDGTKRRRLPLEQLPTRVAWLGKDRLAVQTQVGVYVGSVKNWKPELIDATAYYEISDATSRITAPGTLSLSKYEDGEGAVLNPRTMKLQPIDFSKTPKFLDWKDDKYTTTDPDGAPLVLESGKQIVVPGMSREDKRQFLFHRGWHSTSGTKRLFLLATAREDQTNGDLKSILILESKKKPRVLFGHVIDFDFWEGRPTFAYCSKEIESPLTPKSSSTVTTNELHIGDWIKGTDRKLFAGPVRTISVAIRS
ncbi:MAG: hypothetical protein WCK51_01675 [Armatimonadota bacterium]